MTTTHLLSCLRSVVRKGFQYGGYVGAGTVWVRFVTVFREDQDLLRDSARKLGHYQPITTNYGGDPTAAIPHRLGTAAELARCTGSKHFLSRARFAVMGPQHLHGKTRNRADCTGTGGVPGSVSSPLTSPSPCGANPSTFVVSGCIQPSTAPGTGGNSLEDLFWQCHSSSCTARCGSNAQCKDI